MNDRKLTLPFLSNLGLMLTYRCTTACPHCLVEAGPHRTEQMPLDRCLAWIEEARAYRDGHIQGIALTGGEPFYDLAMLSEVSSRARELGFVVTAVTNAFWASTLQSARDTLRQVPGIRILSISTDVYHQRSIPFRNVRHAIEAAKELDRLYNIAVCTDTKDDPGYQRIAAQIAEIGDAERMRVAMTLPIGRAKQNASSLTYEISSTPAAEACSMANWPVVFPNGDVQACIGPLLTLPPDHPMCLGNANRMKLTEILDRAETNPLLHIIRVWGPRRLVALLEEHGAGEMLPKEYICGSPCDVCYKLMSDERIVRRLGEILDEEEIRQEVAYARIYFLNELAMAEAYGLHTEA